MCSKIQTEVYNAIDDIHDIQQYNAVIDFVPGFCYVSGTYTIMLALSRKSLPVMSLITYHKI